MPQQEVELKRGPKLTVSLQSIQCILVNKTFSHQIFKSIDTMNQFMLFY